MFSLSVVHIFALNGEIIKSILKDKSHNNYWIYVSVLHSFFYKIGMSNHDMLASVPDPKFPAIRIQDNFKMKKMDKDIEESKDDEKADR